MYTGSSQEKVAEVSLTQKVLDDFVRTALGVGSVDFLRLLEDTIRLIAGENGLVGRLRVKGRLVSVPPTGEAIVVGDIHGDLQSLKHILNECGFMDKAREGKETLLFFLGDYGDRGPYSPEVYYVILKLKMFFSDKVVLMRGNHEGPMDLRVYPHDLPYYLERKFGAAGQRVYAKLRVLFSYLYTSVIINERYVFFHGGVPSKVSNVEDIACANEKHPRETHFEEILWSDPVENLRGTCASPRGAGRLFGEDITYGVLKMLNVKAVIRGHEPCENGFKINHGGRILTLFSRKGEPYQNQHGAYLKLNLSEIVENARQLKQYIRIF